MVDQAVLPPRAASAGRARRFVSDALAAAEADAAVDVATLLVTELVSNAVLHAEGELGVRVSCEDGSVRIEVADGSPENPRPQEQPRDATTGRGLLLVDALSASWGVRPDGVGKVVWFELPHPRPADR